jgi:hypothetical protein
MAKDNQKVDANDLVKLWQAEGIDPSIQHSLVMGMMTLATPLVERMAELAGALAPRGDEPLSSEYEEALDQAISLAAQLDEKTLGKYKGRLARKLGMNSREFANALSGAKKQAKGSRKSDFPEEPTFGGWFPNEDDPSKGWLVDYLWDEKTQQAELCYRDPDGKVGTAHYLDINGKRLVPKVDAIVRSGVVSFPSGLGELKDTAKLLGIHEQFYRRAFLLDNPLMYKMASFYSLFTWVYDAFNELPFLRARGDKDTGKSAIMLRTGYLCYRLIRSTGISSTASLKYIASIYKGTIFLDEMDIADQFDERVVMLNVSAMKEQANVITMTSVKTADGLTVFEPVVHNVYGPKLITMYGKFGDPATESRCVTFDCYEKEVAELKAKGIPRRLSDEWRQGALRIRNMDMRWRLEHWQPDVQIPETLEDDRVSTRTNQVTVPIKYLVKDDPEALDNVTKVVLAIYEEQLRDKAASFEARILEAILAVLEEQRFMELGFVREAESGDYGHIRYVRYPDLGKVANLLMDEMNTGKVKDPKGLLKEDEKEEEGETDGKKKKKKGEGGISSKTIGDIARKDLRLPTKRMGTGYIVILESSTAPEAAQERLEVLRVKYGLAAKSTAPKKAADQAASPTQQVEVEMDRYAEMADDDQYSF